MVVPAKIPKLIRFLGKGLIFNIASAEKHIYLTFDDGPIEELTPWVLDELAKVSAKATFFMVGENILRHPELVKLVIENGHAIGNHTHNHLNGFKTKTGNYLSNIESCGSALIPHLASGASKLFRPPYGRIYPQQAFRVKKLGYKIIMWDVLSKDYDQTISPEKCIKNVMENVRNGSIVVFHDNIKANSNLRIALPIILNKLKEKGYVFKALD